MNLLETMQSLGGLAPRRQLSALGVRRHIIDRAIREGRLLRVRPGWVATASASQLAVIAVLRGGRLTGATALRSHEVWSGMDHRIHLQVPRNAHRTLQRPLTPIGRFVPPKFPPLGIVTHWDPSLVSPRQPQWRVTMVDALLQFARAERPEQITAAIESAVHKKTLSRSDVPALLRRLPRRLRRLGTRLTFLADSGLETVGRLRLEDLGYRLAQQVQIGPDRVDLVIDGWLIVEWDGDEWHDPVKDRVRTNRLIRAGYRVLRFGYVEVFEQWGNTVATIRELLGDRDPQFGGPLELVREPDRRGQQ